MLVAPPYTSLVAVVAAAKGSPVAVAAQNMHFEKEGAFTGEVSAAMLKDIGVTHVILGHSERRQYFAETDEGVAKKTKVALDNGLTPDLVRRRDARRARGGPHDGGRGPAGRRDPRTRSRPTRRRRS